MKKLITLAALFLLSGCGTYMARFSDNDISDGSYYPATQMDYMFVGVAIGYESGVLIPFVVIASAVDLPFSLATDTLLLPYDFFTNQKGDTP